MATLQRLAAALGVKMSYFFDTASEEKVIYSRAGNRTQVAAGGVTIEGLGSRLRDQQLEPFHLTLAPHADAGDRQVVHGARNSCAAIAAVWITRSTERRTS